MKPVPRASWFGRPWRSRFEKLSLLGVVVWQCVAPPRAGAQAADAAAGGGKTPDPQALRGNFGVPRAEFGAAQGEAAVTADLGDVYRRNAGESIRLLRATQEAALVVGAEADVSNTVSAAVATGGLRGLAGREFSNLSGGRRIAVVESSEPGRPPNALVLSRVAGVLGVQPVYVDPGSRVRMIPSGEVIVGLKPGVALAEVEPDLKAAGLVLVERVGSPRMNSYLFRQTDLSQSSLALADRLFNHAKIQYASPNFIREAKKYFVPNDPLFTQQQHLHNTGQQGGVADADVDAAEAWDVSQGASTVVIAIVDDGVDTTHPDLTIHNNPGETGGGKETNGIDDDGNGKIDDYRGWDFANGDNNPNPVGGNGHGTACSGVAAAKINNSYRTTGIAANCKIFPVKIFGDNGIATSDANIGAAISYAADYADVLSDSWGGGSPSAFIDAAIVDATTNGRGGKGCPVFFATGNSASIWGHAFFNVGADLGAGTFSFGFRYLKDASIASGEDLVKIDNVVLMDADEHTHLASPLGTNGRQDFEGAFPPAGWTLSSSGGANWSLSAAQAFSGTGGAQSPRSGATANSGWCELRTPNLALAGDEVFTVQLYISSESNYDGLRLYVYNSVGGFVGSYGLISGVYAPYTPVSYPGNHPNAISVGASTDCDRRSDYSEYGPETDFVAPSNGGWNDVTTLDPTGAVGYSTSDYTTGFGGTSSATPLAAGVGALLLSVNPNLTATQVRDTLRNTADKIGPVPYVAGFNNEYGYGRVNARAALDSVSLPTVTVVAVDNAAAEPSDTGRFVITRTGPTTGSLTVNFTVSGTATSGGDYAALGTSIVIPVGSPAATNIVTPIDDAVSEPTETVVLTLSANAAYTVGSPSSATVNISDDDSLSPFLTVDNADGPSRVEMVGAWTATSFSPGYWATDYLHDGNAGKGTKTVTFIPTVGSAGTYEAFIWYTAAANRASNVPVDVIHAGGTTTRTVNERVTGSQWVSLGVYTFNAGTAGRITVRTTGTDGYVIADAVRLVAQAVSPVVTVVASDADAGEPGNNGVFTFSRTGSTVSPLTVNFTVGGSATSGSDYNAVGTSITFAAGWNITNLVINPIDDGASELTETVDLGLSAGTGYVVGTPASATVNITDNDAPAEFLTVDNTNGLPRVEIVGAWTASSSFPGYWAANYLHDGNTGKGTKMVTFIPTVVTSGFYEAFIWYVDGANRASNVPVDVIHAGGTTTRTVNERVTGSQWVSLGVYTFNAGTAGRITVRTTGTDGYVVADAVRLVAQAASPVVTVVASDDNAGEPSNSGVFTFSRTGSTASPLTVNFTVVGSATSGSDYGSIGTSITFAPGWIITNLVINPIDDASAESTETVNVGLLAGTGYLVGTPSSATVSITDNDIPTAFLTVDNTNGLPRVEIVGTWTASSSVPGYWAANYLHEGNVGKGTKTVTFIPTVATTGKYEAFIWYTEGTNRASNVPVDVIHAGGTTTLTVNQRATGGQWVSLGIYTFNAGNAGRIRIRTTATDGYVVADAIRLAPAAGALAGLTSTGVEARPVVLAGQSGATLPRILALRHDGRSATLSVEAKPGATCVLEASADLAAWRVVETRTCSGTILEMVDPAAAGQEQRYYRIRVVTTSE